MGDGNVGTARGKGAASVRRETTGAAQRPSLRALREIIDDAPFGAHLYELQPDGRLVLCAANRASDRIFGVEHDRLAGRPLEEVLPRFAASELSTAFRTVASAGEAFEGEIARFEDGRLCGALEVSAFRSGADRVVALFRDITDRRRAEEALLEGDEKLRAVFRAAPLAIVVTDLEACVKMWNPAAERIFGWNLEEVLGRTPPFVPEDRLEEALALRAKARRGEPYADAEIRRQRKDGSPVELSASAAPLRDAQGRVVGALALFADITARKQAEDLLRESEGKFRRLSSEFNAVLDAIPDSLTLQASDLSVVWANRGAAESLGRAPEELVGQRCYELWHDGAEPCPKCPVLKSFRTGEPAIEFVKDAVGRTWELRSAPIRDEGGVVTAVVEVARDVSQRTQIEAERERLLAEVQSRAAELGAVIASIPDGVVIYAPGGKIVQMNDASKRLLGHSDQELLLPVRERFAALGVTTAEGRVLPLEEAPFMRALGGETVERNVLVVRRPGEEDVWLSVSAAPIRAASHGAVTGAVAVLSDITALRELQELQEDFVRMVSHDLRTPLVSVGGFAQLLLRRMESAGGSGPEIEFARYILAGTQRMNAMIRDLVDSVRLDTGQLRLDPLPVSLVAFVPDMLRQAAAALEVGRVRTEVPADLQPVLADPDRLDRILVNLISNALKYSPPGSEVVFAARRVGDEVEASVADQGTGIAPEDLPRLFDRFFRAHRDRKAEGLGLGLYITRMLVEAQGGRIWVTSAVGKGSTFHFTLPVA